MSHRPTESIPIGDIMSTALLVIEPSETLRAAVELLARGRVSGAPVMEGGRVVGVISASDILAFQATLPGVPTRRREPTEEGSWDEPPTWIDGEDPPPAYFLELWDDAGVGADERMNEPDGPEWDVLAEHTVEEAMTRRLHALPPDADAARAAEHMTTARIHRILVMDGDQLMGIVSASDLVQAMAAGRAVDPPATEDGDEARRPRVSAESPQPPRPRAG
jgi:CBS domain-containing protein